MRLVLQLFAAGGCALIALLFGRAPGTAWESLLMSVAFAAAAGALAATASG